MSRTQRLAEPENFGKYQLIARLAHGRVGDVYKAKSHGVEGFERILVIKTIQPGLAAIPGFVDIVVDLNKINFLIFQFRFFIHWQFEALRLKAFFFINFEF